MRSLVHGSEQGKFMIREKRPSQTGFAMIEVMASILILAFCLLSIAGLLVFTQKSNTSSYVKQQAIQSAYDIIDLMQSNRDAAIAGNYAVSNLGGGAPVAPSTDCTVTACSSAQVAAWDLFQWQTRLALYGGSGAVVMGAAVGLAGLPSQYTGATAQITVQWDDSQAQALMGRSTAAGTGTVAQEQVTISSQIAH
jgi:type IV pilus assembly protein PilV